MTLADIETRARERIEMLGAKVDDRILRYSLEKSVQQAADFSNINGFEYFPPDAEIYIAEYAAAEYLLENETFRPLYEKIRRDAETGLLRFRRIRW